MNRLVIELRSNPFSCKVINSFTFHGVLVSRDCKLLFDMTVSRFSFASRACLLRYAGFVPMSGDLRKEQSFHQML